MNRIKLCQVALLSCLVLALSPPLASAKESLDPSFGEGGIAFPGVGGASINGLAQDKEGRLVGAGGAPEGFILGRFLPNGGLDESFGRENGTVASQLGFTPIANAVAVQSDGKVLAAGSDTLGPAILARYLPDGNRDVSFGRNGSARVNLGLRGGGATDVAALPGGRILATGYGIGENRSWKAAVIAFRRNGSLDRRFGGGDGIAAFTTKGELMIELTGLQMLPSGKIMVAGDIAGRVMVARLLADGRPDRSFSGDGLAYVNPGHCFCAQATGLALDRRGRAVVSANLTGKELQPAVLLRFLPDGRLDRGFGEEGTVRTLLGTRLAAHDVVLQRNGRIVLAGDYNVPGSGEARVAAVRYLPDGRLDPSFGRGGIFTRDFGVEGVAYAALVQRDGRVVIGGRANATRSPFHENESVYDTAEVFLIRFLP